MQKREEIAMREPDFNNILKVLRRETPDRPTLFEFYINNKVSEILSGMSCHSEWDSAWNYEMNIKAMGAAGYDYITMHASPFWFPQKPEGQGFMIWDEASLEAYPFQDPDEEERGWLGACEKILPKGMKVIVFGPGGVLENVIQVMGYENICYMLYDDPPLLERIFREFGERLVRYYEICLGYDCVGAVISNDDWGFNTGTLFSPEDLRKYVFPYHRRIAALAHKAGRPAILHSCGNLESVMDDIIDDMGFDGKHSYEDKIMPVEESYRRYGDRIAILGGVDLDFVARRTPAEIRERCQGLARLTGYKGYGLGTGNSIPDYIPFENFAAMVETVYPEFTQELALRRALD